MAAPERLQNFFRVGVRRRDEFRKVASIGVAQDGGIMIAPVTVPGQDWNYGTSLVEGADFQTTSGKPKLHYHSSGITRVTQSGHDLQSTTLHLPRIDHVVAGQVLSLVAIRPWELPVTTQRRGDFASIHPTWPQSQVWLFQLLQYDGPLPAMPLEADGIGPFGLFGNDPQKWFVNLSGYMENTLLIAHSAGGYDPQPDLEASISVAAFEWSPDRSTTDRQGALTLWSSGKRNPAVAHALPQDVLDVEEFRQRVAGDNAVIETFQENADRMFGPRTVADLDD